MKLRDFVKMAMGGMFTIVDITKQGCMLNPERCTLVVADKNAVTEQYGDKEVVKFEATKKNNLMVFVK